MKNADMPAMPCDGWESKLEGGEAIGLSKREYFAGLAMQGICANSQENSPAGDWQTVARDAARAADALLAELEKEPTQ
jgi:hypothetical protein